MIFDSSTQCYDTLGTDTITGHVQLHQATDSEGAGYLLTTFVSKTIPGQIQCLQTNTLLQMYRWKLLVHVNHNFITVDIDR